MEIRVYNNEVDRAIKILKRWMQREGLLKDLKRREAYEKPSVRKKRKALNAMKRRQRAERRFRTPIAK
jgi:small subunit ribosomal protein S21